MKECLVRKAKNGFMVILPEPSDDVFIAESYYDLREVLEKVFTDHLAEATDELI